MHKLESYILPKVYGMVKTDVILVLKKCKLMETYYDKKTISVFYW